MRWIWPVLVASCIHVSDASPGDIGVAAPIAGMLAAETGHWFVLCQARDDTNHDGTLSVQYDIHQTHGDAVKAYLVLGSGPGEPIDFEVAKSAHDEWLAILRNGKLELIDGTTFQRVTLPADLTDDWEWTEAKNARFISIAGNGSRLAYIRPDNAIVIRELPSGKERVVAMGAKVWRATVDATGHWAEVTFMRADTNHDGKIEWPGGPASGSLHDCNADVIHSGMLALEPTDKVSTTWLDLATGTFVDDPKVIGVVGGELLRRASDDSLVLGATRIVDASCHAQITGIIDDPARVLVTCGHGAAAQNQSERVVVAGKGVFVPTRHTDYRWGRDSLAHQRRFELIDDTTLVDFNDGREIALPGKRAAGWFEPVILVEGPAGFLAYDLARRVATPLGVHGKADDNDLGEQVTIDGAVWDLRFARKLAPPYDTIALVDASGRVLRFASTGKPGFAPMGPLHWGP
jgi:hypothetical protein